MPCVRDCMRSAGEKNRVICRPPVYPNSAFTEFWVSGGRNEKNRNHGLRRSLLFPDPLDHGGTNQRVGQSGVRRNRSFRQRRRFSSYHARRQNRSSSIAEEMGRIGFRCRIASGSSARRDSFQLLSTDADPGISFQSRQSKSFLSSSSVPILILPFTHA